VGGARIWSTIEVVVNLGQQTGNPRPNMDRTGVKKLAGPMPKHRHGRIPICAAGGFGGGFVKHLEKRRTDARCKLVVL